MRIHICFVHIIICILIIKKFIKFFQTINNYYFLNIKKA